MYKTDAGGLSLAALSFFLTAVSSTDMASLSIVGYVVDLMHLLLTLQPRTVYHSLTEYVVWHNRPSQTYDCCLSCRSSSLSFNNHSTMTTAAAAAAAAR